MEKLQFKLETFEGPLDLLLHLISKNKVNICDIPIALILRQYMEYIENMQEHDMDIASEFMTMASELVYIKSKMLLPKYDEEQDGDPREDLVRSLLEYQRYKAVAGVLSQLQSAGENTFTKQALEMEPDMEYKYSHDLMLLYDAFLRIYKQKRRRMPPPVDAFDGIVNSEPVPVSARVVFILRKLAAAGRVNYFELFYSSRNRSEIVGTFLGLLNLLKAGRITVLDEGEDEIFVALSRKKGDRPCT
jgi:segregation and condensation protein A